MKNILGLDLGPNSIGWAVVHADTDTDMENKDVPKDILAAGVRVIPMDDATLDDFNKGNSKSQTAERTRQRSIRRLTERSKLRRARLHRVLARLRFLPAHYEAALDRYGNFTAEGGCKLAWTKGEDGESRFLFEDAFREMIADFNAHGALATGGARIPHDWTLYYLRRKALTRPVSREELAWILLSFNQKRGYYQLREEQEQESEKKKKTRTYFDEQTVTAIRDTGEAYKGLKIFIVELENGTRGKIFKKEAPDWIGQKKSILVTVDLDKDGQERRDEQLDGPSCRFKVPTDAEWDTEWALVKQKAEHDIEREGTSVGSYIYTKLRENPKRKVRGQLVRTIERKYYKEELREILKTQCRFHNELKDPAALRACAEELYPHNEAHRNMLLHKDMSYLLTEDILFYQRPLKSKKSLIDDCPYESHTYTVRQTGEKRRVPVKCIAKSHPLFQEFRLWQFIANLRIYHRDRSGDKDVTSQYLPNLDPAPRAELFRWLAGQKAVKEKSLLKHFKLDDEQYRWNYVEEKEYPAGETHALLLGRLKQAGLNADFLTAPREEALWHLLYSISDREELRKGLRKFAAKNGADADAFCAAFERTPPFEKDYGNYSAKALRKLVPLMRAGDLWSAAAIDPAVRQRIDHLLTGEADEAIPNRVREQVKNFHRTEDFQGLGTWLACYIAYGRHSEARDTARWTSPDDIDAWLAAFRQHSMRNPIVETVVLETLRMVRDIWRQVGHIDEIHVEMGREMKLPANERKKRTLDILENERTNLRVKALLADLSRPDLDVENVRPYSPYQQSLLRIYEEAALSGPDELPEDIADILRKYNETDAAKRPTASDVRRYKLWLEQRYRSPYTGRVIPLSKLFTPAYQIEHIIPQSRYFDDSLSNKVICEAEVNRLKSNQLGHEFICCHHGEKVPLNGGGNAEILSIDEYEKFVEEHYAAKSLQAKRRKLLLDDIPESFTQRQMNDTRYITRTVLGLLSAVVREDDEAEATSKNVIATTGGVTDRLKKDWGVNAVWNEIILPRFQRMNRLNETTAYTALSRNGHELPAVPIECQRGFNPKRIDHRHHAMDAIVTACATRTIVNYLNNSNAGGQRDDLRRILCDKCRTDDRGNYYWSVRKPWDTFTQDVRAILQSILPSFKQNLRILTKTNNRYQHYAADGRKVSVRQRGHAWAIRKSLHKDTVHGLVNLRRTRPVSLKVAAEHPERIVDREFRHLLQSLLRRSMSRKQIEGYIAEHHDEWQDIDLKRIPVYYFTEETNEHCFATRKPLDTSFNRKKINESVTDTGIQKILLRHLKQNGDDPATAFSPEGIERMNADIVRLNGGKQHQPIRKVRTYEQGNKFPVGQRGNKAAKFVEADKGTNLYFAVYTTWTTNPESGKMSCKRSFATIPLYKAIQRLKQHRSPADPEDGGSAPAFVLSPGDLVYLPTKEETDSGIIHEPLDRERIYKVVSLDKRRAFFIPSRVAKAIVNGLEFSSQNKMERALTEEMIKETCLPIKTDRLGNIVKIVQPQPPKEND